MKTNAAGNPILVDTGEFMGTNDLIIVKSPTRQGWSYSTTGGSITKTNQLGLGGNNVFENGYESINVKFSSLSDSNQISIHYNYVGTYKGRKVGANVTFSHMKRGGLNVLGDNTSSILISESLYSGFFTHMIIEMQIDYRFFYTDNNSPVNVDCKMGFNSLNHMEYVCYKDNPDAVSYLRKDNNVEAKAITTSQGTYFGYIGANNNFTDRLGASDFSKNSVVINVSGTQNSFILGNAWGYSWYAPSSTPITLFESSMAQKTADKSNAGAGDELTYTVSQKVNTMGVDTLEKYNSFSIVDTLPLQVDYVSAEMLDASGNRISGSLNYNKSTRKLTYAFTSDYLQNTMKYAGETYRLVIHTKVNSSLNGQKSFTNAAQAIINGSTFSSNTASVKALYDITTKITNGTITESMTDIEAGSTKTVEWHADTGYYVDSITVDGKKVETGDRNGGSYTFSDISNDHEVIVVCKKAETDIMLTKTIAVDDIYFEHGNPSFIFKVSGTDMFGDDHTYYQSAEFDEDYVKKNTFTKEGIRYVSQTVKFSNVPVGNYAASEESVSRYEMDGISDVTAGTVQNGTVVFDLRDGSKGAASFTNANTVYRNDSHNDIIINEIKK